MEKLKRDLFEAKAQDWDRRPLSQQLSQFIGDAMLENVAFHETMHVMDFGAGTGLISGRIAPLVEKIAAVDVSEAMLNALAAKPELRGKVEALCHDITLEALDLRFDAIVSAMAVHHVEDTALLLRRFADHLKPGGVIALADLDKEDGLFHGEKSQGVYHYGFDRDGFKTLLEEAGFTEVRFTTAYTVMREGKAYPIFLAVARKG